MKLSRLIDGFSKESKSITAHKDQVRVEFHGYGKGTERGSAFGVTVTFDETIKMLWEMSKSGSEKAEWVQRALRLNPEIEILLQKLDKEREDEEQEYREWEERCRLESQEEEREYRAWLECGKSTQDNVLG
jgi:hypothetical protein